ncbi:HpsJ-like protein, cyanoexosortase A-associated [Nostoc sp. NIES-3756]|uniref:HpsJ-like protein, cyanoexosortase A-associated n=1 Tax=Nostoc sp. NIES-3756 TaxID=1751286 RepID=UPI0011DF3535|nr:HpsJ family protein [Nostoc sp. NIES-3756]
MTPLDTENWSQKITQLWKFNRNIAHSIFTLRLGGYCLLLLFLLEVIVILTPLRLMNPAWEFQVFGELVERVAIPIIGIIFVFYAQDNSRSKWEHLILKLTYWFTLLFAIMLLLMMPLSIVNVFRIDRQNSQIFTNQVQQQINQLQQIKTQLQQTTTPSQMDEILHSLPNQNNYPKIQTSQQLEEIKTQFSAFIAASENQLKATSQENIANRRSVLMKNCIRWSLGALISGVLLILIWANNHWVRQNKF